MVERALKKFLKDYPGKVFVLGLSGGADSMALFRVLINLNHPFVVAHVDHGWRESSAYEAESLALKSQKEGIPFYLKTFKKSDFEGNLEASARKLRQKFFLEVVKLTEAEGVLLGHHADDLTETTLKKMFEGVSLTALGSMKQKGEVDGLKIFRPFLTLSKQELISYLGDEPFFEDETNHSAQFLRGRLRSSLLPLLSETFGKNVKSAFLTICRESEELQDYFEKISRDYLTIKEPFGSSIDLSKDIPYVVVKVILKKAMIECGVKCFREEIACLAEAIVQKKSRFQRIIGHRRVVADKGYFFIFDEGIESSSKFLT